MRTAAVMHSVTLNDDSAIQAVESDLDIVRRHAKSAEARVAAQRKLIALLAVRRRPSKAARELLDLLMATWQVQVAHLAHVEDVARYRVRARRQSDQRTRHRETAEQARLNHR